MFILGKHLLARKFRKKVFISFSGNQLIIENSPILQSEIHKIKNSIDYKSFLINNGYKIDWDVFQQLLKYW